MAHSDWPHGLALEIDRGAPPAQADLDLSRMGYEYADMPAVCCSDGSRVSASVLVDCQLKQKWHDGPVAYEIVPSGGALESVVYGNDRSQIQLCLFLAKHDVVSMA